MRCPDCGSDSIAVFYTGPLQFECRDCGVKLRDENALPGVSVISGKEAQGKRPRMYGLPCCAHCFHAPHEGKCEECRWCIEKTKPYVAEPHIYKLVKA